MLTTENFAVQADMKRQDAEEMIKLFLNMTELERARVFGYAQGVESMIENTSDKRSA